MKPPHVPRSSELQVRIDNTRRELVRAFVREASLCEGVAPDAASLIATDTAEVWQELCALTSSGERARLLVLAGRQDVRAQIFLHGHSRFSGIAASLAHSIQINGGISWRENGIDGWEVSIRHSMAAPPHWETDAPAFAPKASAAHDYSVDVPQERDAAAIARCFLEVYGRSYVHHEVFSPHRYWHDVESGQLIPVLARDAAGEVVGHVALERRPGTQVAERGEAVVLSAHRGQGLLERMTEQLSGEA